MSRIVIPVILTLVDDWRSTLYAWAGVCLGASISWITSGSDRARGDKEVTDRPERTSLSSLFRYREPWILSFGIAGVTGGRVTFNTFWPSFTGDEYSTDVTLAGLVIGLMYMANSPAIIGVATLPLFAIHAPTVLMIYGIGFCASYFGLLFTGRVSLLLFFGIINGICFSFFPGSDDHFVCIIEHQIKRGGRGSSPYIYIGLGRFRLGATNSRIRSGGHR